MVFSDPTFKRTVLINRDSETITCWLKSESGRFSRDALVSQSLGNLRGYMIEPLKKPQWMIPGVILRGVVLGVPCVLTLEPSFESPIEGLDDELGEALNFSYVINTEYTDVRP